MRRCLVVLSFSSCLLLSSCSGGGGSSTGGGGSHPPPPPPPPAQAGSHVLTAWSELGMHCMDGKDYSVFAVLPPYNTIHAQLMLKAEPPVLVSSGVTVTYEAMADAAGSINTSSAGKTNFWNYVQVLFLKTVAPEVGLAGNRTQGVIPHPMTFNSSLGVWEALGVPTIPYDDAGKRNAYPMAKLVAKDSVGNILATTTVVLAVSDEMVCSTCHASGSKSAAQPASGWVKNANPLKDAKLNILKKHDERWNISGYLSALSAAGYHYQPSLYQTAVSGTPILCAACHGTNALGLAGIAGIKPLTTDMHSMHATAVNPDTGTTLDSATTPLASCYLCHPGKVTRCQRGAMNKTACYDCHGNLSKVGDANRAGWLDVPSCQMCHTNGSRYPTTFDASGHWRTTTDATFATVANRPLPGKSLYRFSAGHGSLYCSACHGSQHAEYPTLQPNDNVSSIRMQGYAGKIVECSVCHLTVPSTPNGGPHGMHNIGADWVSAHHDYVNDSNVTQCAYCHGADYKGTALSAVPVTRAFTIDGTQKTLAANHKVSCYDCHNGPGGQ